MFSILFSFINDRVSDVAIVIQFKNENNLSEWKLLKCVFFSALYPLVGFFLNKVFKYRFIAKYTIVQTC